MSSPTKGHRWILVDPGGDRSKQRYVNCQRETLYFVSGSALFDKDGIMIGSFGETMDAKREAESLARRFSRL